MGDDQHRAPVVQKIVFQPLDGVEVQMVDRFVQEHDIRSLKKELAQGDPGLLSAGQSIHRLVKLLVRKPQSPEYAGDLAFPGVSAFLFEAGLRPVILIHDGFKLAGVRLVHLSFQIAQALFQVDDVLFDHGYFVVNGLIPGQHILLRQVTDRFSSGDGNLAAVRIRFRDDNLKQSGLSCSVDPYNGSFLMFFYMKGYIPENVIGSE